MMQDAVPEEDTQQELMETIQKGNFTMRILYEQLGNILKMGPMGQMMSMIPGFSNSGLFTKVALSPSKSANLLSAVAFVWGQQCRSSHAPPQAARPSFASRTCP